jgi:hypothetical protein
MSGAPDRAPKTAGEALGDDLSTDPSLPPPIWAGAPIEGAAKSCEVIRLIEGLFTNRRMMYFVKCKEVTVKDSILKNPSRLVSFFCSLSSTLVKCLNDCLLH